MTIRTNLLLGAVLMAALAGPALAQDVICGGVGANGVWIGGSSATSDVTTAANAFNQTGVSVPAGGEAVTLFALSAPTEVRIEAMGQFGGDTVIDVRDEGGAIILTDDDSGGALSSRAEATLMPGNYCVSTRGYGGAPLNADVRIGRTEHQALTQGWGGSNIQACLPSTPAARLGNGPVETLLSQGVSATNSIAANPYYRFTLNATTPISIRAENQMADPYIFLYDNSGTLLAENDDYNSLNARLDFTDGLPAGTYCLALRSLADPNVPVTVSILAFDQAAMINDLYASGEASPPIGGAYPISDLGMVQSRLVRDAQVANNAVWFSFTVPQSGMVLIDAIGVGNSDPVISLFDQVGRLIDRNDDSGGTLNSMIASRVNPGTYLLGVNQYHGDAGIIRVAIERFVPAQ